jgi:predicted phage terminase large subunit-like protein
MKNLKLSNEERRQLLLEAARIEFWSFCNLFAPEFYTKSREYLRDITQKLQEFIDSPDSVMIINAPPRHGKSRTASLFCDWLFGINPAYKIMIGSYNEILSQTFSKAVRDLIDTEANDPSKIVYSDVFPGVRIKRGDGAVNRWSLAGQPSSYLATSPTGTSTGFGADILIIDDIIKSDYEANNEIILENHWKWFTDTMMSRLEEGAKIIIIMTRWHTKDLAGRAETHFNSIGKTVKKIVYKAFQDDGNMLCSDILSYESYKMRILTNSPEIVAANYQQEPIDILGKLYSSFKTYHEPPKFESIRAYIDTADEGDDFLACIIYGIVNHEAYIIDVLYTQDAMEKTEPKVADLLTEHHVQLAVIESNNGGRGFARNVERIMKNKKNYFTVIRWFHQHLNKMARILTNSTWVMEHMFFPENWQGKYSEFYESMNTFQKSGKNKHDDAQDAISGVAENVSKHRMGPVNVSM